MTLNSIITMQRLFFLMFIISLFISVIVCGFHKDFTSKNDDEGYRRRRISSEKEVLIVSTLDGVLHGLNVDNGTTVWTIVNSALVSQSLSTLEFMKEGKKYRLVPSLDGQLYMLEVDGGKKGLHALPITADSLFTSSFQLSSESLLVGGREQRVLGFNPHNGEVKYRCDKEGCLQTPSFSAERNGCDLLLCRRVSHIVRAVDIESGLEKWNFSVGQDEVITTNMASLPRHPAGQSAVEERLFSRQQSDCLMLPEDDGDDKDAVGTTSWSFSVDGGEVQASSRAPFSRLLWRRELGASLSRVWLLRGHSLRPLSLFSRDSQCHLEHASDESGCPLRRSIFLGSFLGHMYIQLEDGSASGSPRPLYVALAASDNSLSQLSTPHNRNNIVSRHRVSKVTQHNTAVAAVTLQQGFFKPSNKDMSSVYNNKWFTYNEEGGESHSAYSTDHLIVRFGSFFFQKIAFVCLLLVIGHLIFKTFYLPHQLAKLRSSSPSSKLLLPSNINNNVEDNKDSSHSNITTVIMSEAHVSRYETDYEHVRCLGRGAFGVVFEARHRVDGYHYAVKRVRVRYSCRARDRLLGEVQAFAHLEHPGIVRYYQAWFELPPSGWQEERDRALGLTGGSDSGSGSTEDTGESSEPPRGGGGDRGWSDSTGLQGGTLSRDADSLVIFDRSLSCDLSSFHNLRDSASSSSINRNSISQPSVSSNNNNTASVCSAPNTASLSCSHIYLFISMHLYSGTTLQHRLQQHLASPPPRLALLSIFAQIVDAVSYLHSNGLMHRDLKPSNILFDNQDHIRIADFGLATPLLRAKPPHSANTAYTGHGDSAPLLHTSNVGTELYMSPEQQLGSLYDQKVDIFALGIIFIELMVPLHTAMERAEVLTKARQLKFGRDLKLRYREEIEFVSQLLQHDPSKRPSCEDILSHGLLACVVTEPGRVLPRSRSLSQAIP